MIENANPHTLKRNFHKKKLQLKQKYCNAFSQKIMMNENFIAKKRRPFFK